MSNINGNAYPAWGINAANQVFAVDSNNKTYVMSTPDFAQVIAISESGILWVISSKPDPNSGSVIFWSKGDGNWVSMGKNIPGAVLLTGGQGDSATYYTEDGTLWTIDPTTESYALGNIEDIQELDYGGGMLWAVFPQEPGGIPCLQFASNKDVPWKWQTFKGDPQPVGISASYYGDCYGALSYSPVFFGKDGVSTNSAGAGANGSTLELSFKNNFYLLSTNADKNGNEVMVWKDVNGGVFVNAGFEAIQILGTYYLANG